jgi:DNA replication protein DnaC
MSDPNIITITGRVKQLPINEWNYYIGESTVADAIMDRLAVNAHRIDLKGESLRKKN